MGLGIMLTGCDYLVDVDTGSATSVLVVDAWVTDKDETQTIYLTFSQDYFDNDELPPAATGATVTVSDTDGNVYTFEEDTDSEEGAYNWTRSGAEVFGTYGMTYTLEVVYEGETFQATCKTGRVPDVDSITYELVEDHPGDDDDTWYQGQFWATDPEGTGDTYWIKTYKDGTLLNKTSEINIAYDAAKTETNGYDGVTFISAVRRGINANETDDDDKPVSPLSVGDSLYVEINSLTTASYTYWSEVLDQTASSGGLSELFTATPLANVSTNIVNLDANGSDVVGFFNVAKVSGLGKKFEY